MTLLARQQQATVTPAASTQILDIDTLRKLVAERDKYRTDIATTPQRLAKLATQLDAITVEIGKLEASYRKASDMLEQSRNWSSPVLADI